MNFVGQRLGTAQGAHSHGPEVGEGLFGLPLEGGNWALVGLWLLPLWWVFFKEHYKVEVKLDVEKH